MELVGFWVSTWDLISSGTAWVRKPLRVAYAYWVFGGGLNRLSTVYRCIQLVKAELDSYTEAWKGVAVASHQNEEEWCPSFREVLKRSATQIYCIISFSRSPSEQGKEGSFSDEAMTDG